MTDLQDALEELQRLFSLRSLDVLDTVPEDSFDRFTRLATRVIGAPVSLVSFADSDRQVFKSQVGLSEPYATECQTPLSHSFCQYVVSTKSVLTVTDAREVDYLGDNLAIRDLNLIVYAGAPLYSPDGQVSQLRSPCGMRCEYNG